MPSDYDATEFVDGDFQAQKSPASGPAAGAGQAPPRAPTREEVDAELAQTQQQLAELTRQKEEKERQRAALEETRRRQMECTTGRQEMIQNLTRGLGLLEQAEFTARREAEQMAKTLADFRDALAKIQAVHEESWTQDNFNVELTRALTTIENARMEWNAARLKFPVLTAPAPENSSAPPPDSVSLPVPFGPHSFGELCRVGFALTWPVTAVVLLGLIVLLALLLRH